MMKIKNFYYLLLVALTPCLSQPAHAQQNEHPVWKKVAAEPPTLGIDQGNKTFPLKELKLQLLNSSQTASSIKLIHADTSFDYTATELLNKRDRNGFFHIGDINLKIRNAGNQEWQAFSSANNRQKVLELKPEGNVLAMADLSSTLQNIPLKVIRKWEDINGNLQLTFQIINNSNKSIEIGGLGIPLPFNNNMDWKSLDEAHAKNVFFDPYIGKDAGYMQVNRLHGNGPSLLVLPSENAGFEAYNPLNTDPTPRSITFEGFHEWLIHSKTYAETEWQNVNPWNQPTSSILKPGETKNFSLRFVLAPSIKEIESTLLANNRPVAIAAPGYVVPLDNQSILFIKQNKQIKKIEVFPKTVLRIKTLTITKNNWYISAATGNICNRANM